jgi:hypothetical protein
MFYIFQRRFKKTLFLPHGIAQVHIESNGELQLIPTFRDDTVIIGSVENLEDKLNKAVYFL